MEFITVRNTVLNFSSTPAL